ncbi:MAG TPA: hypothetical protein VGI40_03350 [Pirellulaceae bacterium]|jgi:hypothetical protein
MEIAVRKANVARWRTGPKLAAKIAVVAALGLCVRMIVAQAPAVDLAVKEEKEDEGRGFKYQVPNPQWRKRPDEQKFRTIVRSVFAGSQSIAEPAQRQLFRSFFVSFVYPMMTTEEGLRTIGKERQDLLRDLASTKSHDVHKEVVDFTIPAMTKIVQDKEYRPQARYNAMLILSSLNDVEANNVGTSPTLPEPAKAALPIILQQHQKADRDEIKLAALLGLARNLEWDNYKQQPMPANGRAAIIKELTTLAEMKESPAGREADVHLWMRRRAVEGLAAACLTKADPEIAAVMERLLRDEADATSLRLAVATAMGRMSLQAPAKIDAVATAKELGYLALKACDTELTRAETYRKDELEHQARLAGSYQGEAGYAAGPGGMPGGPGRGMGDTPGGMRAPLRPTAGAPGMGDGYGGELGASDPSMQDPKHFEVEYLRRRLRQSLYAVQLGLLGGDDHPPPKKTDSTGSADSTKTKTTTPTTTKGAEEKKERGMYAVAKTKPEKAQVDEVYWAVRKLAETIEVDGADIDFYQLIKDGRRDLKPLEAVVGRRAPPPGAAPGTEDEPTAGKAKAGAKGAPQKGPPGAKGRPVVPGKAASKPAPRPQPSVFGQPRFGK